MGGWRYLLFELDGQGGEELVTADLKLSAPRLTRALSTPHQITGTISVPDASLLPGGKLALKRWKSSVMAEDPNGHLWVGGLVADFDIDGPALSLDVAGFTAFPKDQPYDAEYNGVGVDPLDVVRDIWSHVQSQPGGNLGLEIDQTKSGLSVGTPPEDVSFTTGDGEQVNFTAGPIKLNWWSTDDAGGKVDDFAKETPFDYLEDHFWDGENVRHQLRIGYPTLGRLQERLRFVLGENVFKVPQEAYQGEDVVTEVWVLGAGEGRTRIRGVAALPAVDSLRRVKIIDDKTITTVTKARQVASDTLGAYRAPDRGAGIAELFIRNHSNAPLGSYDVGDIIPYVGDHDWGTVDTWVRIVKMTLEPESGDHVVATVVRATE